jgi:uncharacterized membrane protein YfcA
VGFTVGMTGMGGGALMTPILLIFFGINPTTAVSSDLVAAMVMKPVGGGVHVRRKTVQWDLVRWLCVGSIPMAFAGVFILHATGDNETVQNVTKILLGVTLLLAAAAMVFKAWLQGRRSALARAGLRETLEPGGDIHVKIPLTIAVGALGGLLVGLTSVGSGSIIIVCLMLIYPQLRGAQLVGTDLVQAVPLVASAAIAHIIVGDFELGLTVSILIGGIPAVYLGARLSSRARDGVIRPALVFVLLASALKLLDVPTLLLGILLLVIALVGLPLWAAVDAAAFPETIWNAAGLDREQWIHRLVMTAPIGVGFFLGIQYFRKVRPKLVGPVSDGGVLAPGVPTAVDGA